MKQKIGLRIAAVLMLLHTIGHTLGALTWKRSPDPRISSLIEKMFATHSVFMGREISMGLFYDGYGIAMIFVLFFTAVLIFLLSGHVTESFTRNAAVLTSLFLLSFGICEWIYFFPFAAMFSLVSGLVILVAMIPARRL